MAVERQTEVPVDLRRADEEEVQRIVHAGLEDLRAVELRGLFSNPFLDAETVAQILGRAENLGNQEVRRLLAGHRLTPLPEALRLVPTLYWADLLELGGDARVRPQVRRAAHRALLERYDGLAVGERVSIARRAGTGLLSRVRHDPEVRVLRAMLENPRTTEGVLTPLLVSGAVKPEALRLIAASDKWCSRYQVRRLLCRHPRTPMGVVLPLLASLKKGDLRALEAQPGLRPEVQRRVRLLLGKDGLD